MRQIDMAREEVRRRAAERKAFQEKVVKLAREGLPLFIIAERLGVPSDCAQSLGAHVRAAGVQVVAAKDWLP